MKKHTILKVLAVIFIPVVILVLWSIVAAIIRGERALKNIVMAPWNEAVTLAKGFFSIPGRVASAISGSKPVQDATAAAQLPSLTATELDLHNATQLSALSDYAPGGKIYQDILNSQGKAAADAAYATVQAHYADEQAQAEKDQSWFSWFLG